MNENLKSCNLAEMETLFKELGQPKFRAKQVYTWLHKGVRSYDEMSNLPKNLREILKVCPYIRQEGNKEASSRLPT